MQIQVHQNENEIRLEISGMLRKQDGLELGEEIISLSRQKPNSLILDLTQLITLSLDSVPFIISAIERGRFGKQNVKVIGCNSNVKKTLRGHNFERIGQLDP